MKISIKNCIQVIHIWLFQVVGDGLAAQESNPEVEVDISRPDVQINEQIFALKLVTNKLDAAYNGHTVEWPHYEPSKYNNLRDYINVCSGRKKEKRVE